MNFKLITIHCKFCSAKFVTRLKGFEPLTHCLEGSCSIQLSYRRNQLRIADFGIWIE